MLKILCPICGCSTLARTPLPAHDHTEISLRQRASRRRYCRCSCPNCGISFSVPKLTWLLNRVIHGPHKVEEYQLAQASCGVPLCKRIEYDIQPAFMRVRPAPPQLEPTPAPELGTAPVEACSRRFYMELTRNQSGLSFRMAIGEHKLPTDLSALQDSVTQMLTSLRGFFAPTSRRTPEKKEFSKPNNRPDETRRFRGDLPALRRKWE